MTRLCFCLKSLHMTPSLYLHIKPVWILSPALPVFFPGLSGYPRMNSKELLRQHHVFASQKVGVSSRDSTFPVLTPFSWALKQSHSCSHSGFQKVPWAAQHMRSHPKTYGRAARTGPASCTAPFSVRSPEWDPVNESILGEGEAKRWAEFHSKDQEECRSEISLNLFEPCSIPWEELNCSPSSDKAQGED